MTESFPYRENGRTNYHLLCSKSGQILVNKGFPYRENGQTSYHLLYSKSGQILVNKGVHWLRIGLRVFSHQPFQTPISSCKISVKILKLFD